LILDRFRQCRIFFFHFHWNVVSLATSIKNISLLNLYGIYIIYRFKKKNLHRWPLHKLHKHNNILFFIRDRRGRDRMVVRYTTTYASSAYHHCSNPFIARCTWYSICDKVCQWLTAGLWFSLATLVSPPLNRTPQYS
jgi:hypothetical protein